MTEPTGSHRDTRDGPTPAMGVDDGRGRDEARPGPRGWRAWWHHPLHIRAIGEEPDYRFSLANERTFLAWIRTALALLAGGVAVVQVVPSFSIPGARHVLGVPLVLMSIMIAASSYRHWANSERALRLHHPLPLSALPRILGAGIALVSLVTLVFILLGGRGGAQ